MYKYTGTDGAHFIGIPARDLSDAEFAALDKSQQEAVKSGSIYQAVGEPKEEPKDEPKPAAKK